LKPAKLRPWAEEDLVEAARHYGQQGGVILGERLFDSAVAALKSIEQMPAIGSPRLALLCEIPALRSWRIKGFPMQWFYFEGESHLDVVRLLGDRQDIATLLTGAD